MTDYALSNFEAYFGKDEEVQIEYIRNLSPENRLKFVEILEHDPHNEFLNLFSSTHKSFDKRQDDSEGLLFNTSNFLNQLSSDILPSMTKIDNQNLNTHRLKT